MLVKEFIHPTYTLEEMSTYELLESDNGWNINISKAAKTGLKKYQNDAVVMGGLNKVLDFIKSQNKVPAMKDYPPELYVHMLTYLPDKPFWAHLWGKRIGMVWRVEPGEIFLKCIGTHNDCGIGSY